MTKLGKKNQKRLAKLVSMALMCAGGLYSLPSAASAAKATVTHVTGDSGAYTVTSDPAGSVVATSPGSDQFYAPTADVLDITGTFGADSIYFFGGYSSGAGVSGKTINVKGTDISVFAICGGWDDTSGSVEGNTVNVTAGTTRLLNIAGGWGGSTSGNHMNITGGTINYGGYGCFIYGGRSGSGDAENNTVTISGGKISPINSSYPTAHVEIYGGFTVADGKNAKGNEVTIKGNASITGTTNLQVYGGRSNGTGGNATGNTVTISGSANVAGDVYGGMATSGNAGGAAAKEGNKVTISGGTITGNVYGGNSNGNGNATYNEINITGGTIGTEGSWLGIYGGVSTADEASHNKVSIKDAIINDHIYGATGNTAADYNEVTISGATTFGKDDMDNYFLVHGGIATTTNNNIVNILSPVTVGGISGGESATSSGNTLNLGASGIEVRATATAFADVSAFQTIALTKDVAFKDGATVIHANQFVNADYTPFTGTLDITGATGLTGATGTGTMKLLASETANNFTTLDLKYIKNGETQEYVGTDSVVVKESAEGGETPLTNGVTLTTGASKHTVSLDTTSYKNVTYTIEGDGGVKKIDLANWNGTAAASMDDYTLATKATIETDGMENLPTATTTILTSTKADYFKTVPINGENAFDSSVTFEEKAGGVAIAGKQGKGVDKATDNKSVVYRVGTKDVETVTLGTVAWTPGDTPLLDGSDEIYNYADAELVAKDFSVDYGSDPKAVESGTMTLLKANNTLAEMAEEAKYTSPSYTVTSVPGVTVEAVLKAVANKSGNNIVLTTTNQATKLTFTKAEWNTPVIAHATTLKNIIFDGADVDISKLNFTGVSTLNAKDSMILVSDFGDTVGEVTNGKYTVEGGLTGDGEASLEDRDGNGTKDLVFTATTGTGDKPGPDPDEKAKEIAHNALMGAEVGMAALSAGNDFIGTATEGLSLASNIGADGVSSYANMGGGSIRQETGSHVDTHTWNAIIALGHQNKKERGTTEYGAFFEYGSGNYTTFNDAGERGDGSMHYTGGGLLAKWRKNDGLYVEGSLRAGTVHDDARNVLRDVVTGNPASYETNAGYFGAHIGVGKEIEVADGNTVDVYGKYFYNRRNSVDFTAGGSAYDLDAVTSSVLRIGARYTMKRESWNFYGGLAYEHELDGEATGKRDGAAIRGADIKGGSGRLEIGATMKPDKAPWSLDLNITGFAGKKQGIMGGVSVAWMF